MEETPQVNVEASFVEEKPKRKFHPAVLAVLGVALCAVIGVGALFAVSSLQATAADEPKIEAPASAQSEPSGVPVLTVTDESGEIVSDDGMSVNVEVYEGEIPKGGNIVK